MCLNIVVTTDKNILKPVFKRFYNLELLSIVASAELKLKHLTTIYALHSIITYTIFWSSRGWFHNHILWLASIKQHFHFSGFYFLPSAKHLASTLILVAPNSACDYNYLNRSRGLMSFSLKLSLSFVTTLNIINHFTYIILVCIPSRILALLSVVLTCLISIKLATNLIHCMCSSNKKEIN
jgi:hypothetical protein